MEQQAAHVLAVLDSADIAIDTKLGMIHKLKAYVKHHHVPLAAISPSFDVVRAALSSSHFVDAGFSTLSHLIKRLTLQGQQHVLASQGSKTYPYILDRLSDQKDRVRSRAIQALSDFWLVSSTEVEHAIRDIVLSGKSPRAKEAGMHWVVMMSQEHALPFRNFIPHMIDCLEDADESVRETAKVTVIELFKPASDAAKSDLKKKLLQHNVRKSIVAHILTHLGITIDAEILPSSSSSTLAASICTARELDEMFQTWLPVFEGKESELNWAKREQIVIELRTITNGGTPDSTKATYLTVIKGLMDGILKAVNSLRTTLASNGCSLLQDIVRVSGHDMDAITTDIILQNVIKLSGSTKIINAQNANATAAAVFTHLPFRLHLLQHHIMKAAQDKNVRPRQYATEWLKIILTKHNIEHAGGLQYVEKCLGYGLLDKDKSVRDSAKSTYWTFVSLWPDRSESVLSGLTEKQKELLLNDPSNPNANVIAAASTVAGEPKAPVPVPSKSSVPKTSFKRFRAAQKEAEAPKTTSSTEAVSKTGSLSAAPLRPTKLATVARPKSALKQPITRVNTPETPVIQKRVSWSDDDNNPSLNQTCSPPAEVTLPTTTTSSSSDLYHTSAKITPIPMSPPAILGPSGNSLNSRPASVIPQKSVSLAAASSSPQLRNTSKKIVSLPMSPSAILGTSGNNLKSRPVPLATRKSMSPRMPISRKEAMAFHQQYMQQTWKTYGETARLTDSTLENPYFACRLLESGITGIRASTLDATGYRKLRSLIKGTKIDIWSEGLKFDELLEVLLEELESPTAADSDSRPQALATVRTMVDYRYFVPSYPRALCALVSSRKYYVETDHMAYGIEEMAVDLVNKAPVVFWCLEALLSLLDKEIWVAEGRRTVSMTLFILSGLLFRDQAIDMAQQGRMARLADRALSAENIDIRRSAIQFTLAFYRKIGDDGEFWRMFILLDDDVRQLLTYYLAKEGLQL